MVRKNILFRQCAIIILKCVIIKNHLIYIMCKFTSVIQFSIQLLFLVTFKLKWQNINNIRGNYIVYYNIIINTEKYRNCLNVNVMIYKQYISLCINNFRNMSQWKHNFVIKSIIFYILTLLHNPFKRTINVAAFR